MNPYYKYDSRYLNGVDRTLNAAIAQHARLSVIRADLRFPAEPTGRNDDTVISLFFEALKYRLDTLIQTKRANGLTCHNQTSLRYIWCREYGEANGNRHYHVMLMLNKDVFRVLGCYLESAGEYPSLANLISQAWCSALKLPPQHFAQLVHFPDNPITRIERNSPQFNAQYEEVRKRAVYLAKSHTKQYGNGRSFGCSQSNPSMIG